jgi:hypothetical protein
MMALLYEAVSAFKYISIECLGDLNRYRMAINKGTQEYGAWENVSRSWYSKAAGKTPAVGRFSHHLATLMQLSSLQQLYYCSKFLIAEGLFEGSRQSIMGTLNTDRGRTPVHSYTHAAPIDESFISAHAYFFERDKKESHEAFRLKFTEELDSHVGRVTGVWKGHGVVCITHSNSLHRRMSIKDIRLQ